MQLSTSEMGMVALSKSENRDEWPKTEDEKSDLIKMVVGVASILACALFHGDQVRSLDCSKDAGT